jgi:macrolide transport system ATP-binding/permease protein
MTLLTLTDVTKAYGDNQVLNRVSLTLAQGDKRGLVGANGVGKSTLVKIIAGELQPDSGAVHVAGDAVIGYLPQVLQAAADWDIDQVLTASQQRVLVIEARLRELEVEMARSHNPLDVVLAEYSQLSYEFERLGGYGLEHRIQAVLTGLGVAHLSRARRMATLSGGEKARVGLASLLLQTPDLLLLDEPTNHLDFAALEWLENFLQGVDCALLVVSHDRFFLNHTVQAIIEIDEYSKEAKFYAGSYDFFAEEKARQRAKWVEEYWGQQEEIRELRRMIRTSARQVAHNRPSSDGDKLAYNAKGQRVEATVARNVRSAEERLRRIEEEPIPKPPKPMEISPEFEPATLASKTPLALSQISVQFGGRTVLDDVTCTIGLHSRVVIVGPNGAGKSTLLKVMAGALKPDAGSVSRAPGVVVGYLDQEQETLPIGADKSTLLEVYGAGLIGSREELVREIIGYGLFVYDDLLKPVAALSVGQKRKLQLAQLIAARANLLLLDEPTNHISFDVLEEFDAALLRFPGPVVAISHDRRFIERVAGEVWEMNNGSLDRTTGGWSEILKASTRGRK